MPTFFVYAPIDNWMASGVSSWRRKISGMFLCKYAFFYYSFHLIFGVDGRVTVSLNFIEATSPAYGRGLLLKSFIRPCDFFKTFYRKINEACRHL